MRAQMCAWKIMKLAGTKCHTKNSIQVQNGKRATKREKNVCNIQIKSNENHFYVSRTNIEVSVCFNLKRSKITQAHIAFNCFFIRCKYTEWEKERAHTLQHKQFVNIKIKLMRLKIENNGKNTFSNSMQMLLKCKHTKRKIVNNKQNSRKVAWASAQASALIR